MRDKVITLFRNWIGHALGIMFLGFVVFLVGIHEKHQVFHELDSVLPKGYVMTQHIQNKEEEKFIFHRGEDETMEIRVVSLVNQHMYQIPFINNSYQAENVDIEGTPGILYVFQDTPYLKLTCVKNNHLYDIDGFLTKDEIFNIASWFVMYNN